MGRTIALCWTGATGASNSFDMSSTVTTAISGFIDNSNGNSENNSGTKSLQNPGDAALTYNGVSITRSGNVLTDVLG